MKRSISTLGVSLILTAGLAPGEAAPAALGHVHPARPATRAPGRTPQAPGPRVARLPSMPPPPVHPPLTPGDVIPHAYMVFGLRTGPNGMAFTSADGALVPLPAEPQAVFQPFSGGPFSGGSFNGPPATPPRTSFSPQLTLIK